LIRVVFVLIRAATYAAVFVGLFLVFLPGQILGEFGVVRPSRWGGVELAGATLVLAGLALTIWCILSFAVLGRGTPAPFDPPRYLVIRGPYRFVRNPMYLGAVLALLGAAVFYRSAGLLAYAGTFLVVTHLFVIGYEEPTLSRAFGEDYRSYRGTVHRWIPKRP
jgi:protein-S-isoprenylcysteine O-methyltransferase Ste14